MILTTHALTGAVVGKNLDSPWLIIILSLILHYALDTFRHGEYLDRESTIKSTWWKVSLDIIIGTGIITFTAYFENFDLHKISLILLGTFFSMLPDLFTLLYWKMNFKIFEKIYRFHAWIHSHPPLSEERQWNLRNSVNDTVFSLIAIILLLL